MLKFNIIFYFGRFRSSVHDFIHSSAGFKSPVNMREPMPRYNGKVVDKISQLIFCLFS